MRPKSLVLLALALGCGLIASIGISQVIQARNAQQPSSEEHANILVALADIPRNADLSTENVGLMPWPKANVPEGAMTKMEDVAGRRPATPIVKGEPILASKVGTGEGPTRASKDIPKNFRVVPVRVDDRAGAGLILPGDRVDVQVYTATNPQLGIGKTGIRTLLQDVSVFAVNSAFRNDPNSENSKIEAKTISLLVTPEQAAKLTLAAEVGTIRLVMRGTQPEEEVKGPEVSVGQLLGSESENGGTQTSAAPSNPLKDFLDHQKDTTKATPPPTDDTTWRVVVVEGSDPHVEEFHKGELLPRRVSGDGSTATPDVTTPPPASDPQADGAPPAHK